MVAICPKRDLVMSTALVKDAISPIILNSLGTAVMKHISAARGRGLVATRALAVDSLIDVCPILHMNATDFKKCEKTILYNYLFGVGEEEGGIALGMGSLYNHESGDGANLRYEIVQENAPSGVNDKERADYSVRYWAKRDIQAGDELVIDYQQRFGNTYPLWFSYDSKAEAVKS